MSEMDLLSTAMAYCVASARFEKLKRASLLFNVNFCFLTMPEPYNLVAIRG